MWEGEERPAEATHDDAQAFAVYAMLANGMGGLDWGALPFAAEFHGVDDIEALTQRLLVIKLHRPKRPGEE